MRELKAIFKALADTSRLGIVLQLGGCEETTVTELAGHVRISQPLISWHLRILRRAGLVRTRRVGRTVFCSLNRDRLQWTQVELSRLSKGQMADDSSYARAVLMADHAVEA